jgi:hypothetical protein
MKIRIKGNALRYRLTRSDIAALSEESYLEETTAFAGQSLVYAINIAAEDRLSASYINNTITLYISAAMIKELASTERVGFEDKTTELYLLVEKDFTCLDNVEEDQSDNYPNPLATEAD